MLLKQYNITNGKNNIKLEYEFLYIYPSSFIISVAVIVFDVLWFIIPCNTLNSNPNMQGTIIVITINKISFFVNIFLLFCLFAMIKYKNSVAYINGTNK